MWNITLFKNAHNLSENLNIVHKSTRRERFPTIIGSAPTNNGTADNRAFLEYCVILYIIMIIIIPRYCHCNTRNLVDDVNTTLMTLVRDSHKKKTKTKYKPRLICNDI